MNKKIFLIVGAVALFGLLFFAYQQFTSYQLDQAAEAVVKETVTNDELGLSFMYPTGETGFTLIEPPAGENGLLKAYLMMPTKAYQDLQASDDARETPASISVLIFTLDEETLVGTSTERADRITRLQNWAIDNTSLTSFTTPKATPEIVEMDGLKAFHYQADGLYQQDIYLASYRGQVYMFATQYNEESDMTFTAFQELIASASFN